MVAGQQLQRFVRRTGAATAAGLVAFAIGTETRGSIISPSSTCGVVGLRPTYGRVSRYGAMALSWSMDKIGPMCRSVEDCAIVFNAIYGSDGRDETVVDAPFNWNPDVPLSSLKIGVLESEFDVRSTSAADVAAPRTLKTHDAAPKSATSCSRTRSTSCAQPARSSSR